MTTRIPLIINAGSAQIQELPNGDDLNVSSGNISVINITATGAITVNSADNATALINGGSNTAGNIGSSSKYFNTVFATSTTALYADLAEKYLADDNYAPGTVVDFGGNNEVTLSTASHSTQVAGVISTNPAYQMNAGLNGENVVVVALTGRVPCRVKGDIKKGDRLVASEVPGVATVLNMDHYQPGCIVGKSLENYSSDAVGTIEIVVGRI
jgi:hypothetical protein